MRIRCLLFTPLCFSLLCFHGTQGVSLAQESVTSSAQTKDSDTTVKASPLALLDEVLNESLSLKLPENRAWVQAQSAAILWKHDEARTRQLFRDAFATLEQMASEPEDEPAGEYLQQRSYEMRDEVLRLVAEHDLTLAREYLHRPGQGANADESQIVLDAAAHTASDNPQQALLLA